MKGHHTSKYSHANLADTDTRDCHLEYPHRAYVPKKIDEIFQDLPNVSGIPDDILVVGYNADGKDHEESLNRVLQRCRQFNLKLNKDSCHFRCSSVPFSVRTYPGIVSNLTHERSKY